MSEYIQKSPITPTPEGLDLSVGEYVWEKLDTYADKQLLLDSVTGHGYTGSSLKERAETVAMHLMQLGIRPRDVLTVYSSNSPEVIVMLLAAFRIGATVTLLNAMAVASDVKREITRTNTSLLFTDAACVQNALKGALTTHLKKIVINGEHPGCLGLSTMAQRPTGVRLPAFRDLGLNAKEDVAFILFSSGTTGLPKALLLTHLSTVYGVRVLTHPCFDLPPSHIPLFQPIAHIYGSLMSLSGICTGACIVVIQNFTLEGYVQLVAKYKVPLLALVPPVSVMLAKSGLIQKYDLSCVTSVINAAAPLPQEVGEDLQRQLGGKVLMRQAYGLTETGGASVGTPGVAYQHVYKPLHDGSVGVLMPGSEGKVIDVDSGRSLGPDKEGEICFRSPLTMKGYLNNPQATAETLDKDGWLHTGDIGFYDANGCWYVVDRIKELIKYNANQVSPSELENTLLTHPALADVAVIGLPDVMAGELPMAWVVLKPGHTATAKEIEDYVAGKVSPHKKLRGGVRFVAVIPKSPSGKILRRILKETVLQELKKAKL